MERWKELPERWRKRWKRGSRERERGICVHRLEKGKGVVTGENRGQGQGKF